MYNLTLYHNTEQTNNVLVYIYENYECPNFALHSIKSIAYGAYEYIYKLDLQEDSFSIMFEFENVLITNVVYSQTEQLDSCGQFEKNIRLRISTKNKHILQNFMKAVNNFFSDKMNNYPSDELIIMTYNYGWEQQFRTKKRTMDTIYIPKETKDNLLLDLDKFHSIEFETMFKKLCLVHRRIYLLHGIPGSGKTSTVKAIASLYNKKVAVLDFDNDMDDKTLKNAIKKLPKNSILLLEDIDCIFNDRKTNDQLKNNITFSGILNALDGIVQTSGTIIFITTNHIEKLDEALKRRIDYFVNYTYATVTDTKILYNAFFPTKSDEEFHKFYIQIKNQNVTINKLQKFFTKYYFDDINEYVNELFERSIDHTMYS